MHAVLFYAATIAFAAGILFRSFLFVGLPTVLFGMVLAGVCALLWSKKRSAPSAPYVLVLSVMMLFAAFGILRMEWASWSETDPSLESLLTTEITIQGVIAREPDIRDTTSHVYIEAHDRIFLIITDRYVPYQYGDRVSVTGELLRPESFETDLGRTFNYRGYLLARGTAYMMIYPDMVRVSSGEGNILQEKLLSVKHMLMRSIEQVLPEPHAGLGEGLLLGVKRALGDELEAVFRKAGIIHIVVLSGYNIMLVVTFVLYLSAYVLPLRARMLFGITAIIIFALIVGFSATVLRASIMASLLLIARAIGQTSAIIRTLLFAGCIMLFFNPYLLAFDTGFQLSFLATLGLILAAPYIENRLGLVPTHIGAREFLTATLATQIFVLPLLLYQIGEFSVVSVVMNVLVLPMVPIAMLGTFAAGVIGMFSTVMALPFTYTTYLSLSYILILAEWFASLPFATYQVPAFPFWVLPFVYSVIGYGVWRLRLKNTDGSNIDPLQDWTIVDEHQLFGIKKSRSHVRVSGFS